MQPAASLARWRRVGSDVELNLHGVDGEISDTRQASSQARARVYVGTERRFAIDGGPHA